MEFKGSNGKWELEESNAIIKTYYLYTDNGTYLGLVGGLSSEQNKANAQLISKAPEMLEMLTKLHLIFEGRVMPHEQNIKQYSQEIKELIKEATTI